MNIKLTTQEKAFETEVKEFLANDLPADIRAKVLTGKSLKKDDHIRWQKILFP